MKHRIPFFVAGILLLATSIKAQTPQWPLPQQFEKDLSARAIDTTEITLDKTLLQMAAKSINAAMTAKETNGKNIDFSKVDLTLPPGRMFASLDGVYIREYKFDEEHPLTAEDVDTLRQYFETKDWTPSVRKRSVYSRGEDVATKAYRYTDVFIKSVNNEVQGLFVMDARPNDITIALVLGPIRLEDLGNLSNLDKSTPTSLLGIINSATHHHHADTDDDAAPAPPERPADDSATDTTKPADDEARPVPPTESEETPAPPQSRPKN